MSPTLEVALATDARYMPHAAALMHSVMTSNAGTRLRLHLLHPPRLRRRTLARVEAMVGAGGATITFHPISDAAVAGLPTMPLIPRVMWYRLLLPKLLPDVTRVLYLDSDALVLDDLTPLWRLDLEGCHVGAVTNLLPADLRHRPAELGLSTRGYFNSGVLLIDLDRWRATDCAERVARLAREHPERLVFPDQDALNLVLAQSRMLLPPRWNCQNSILYYDWAGEVFEPSELAEARSHPAIVHFEGPAQAKPWHADSPHPYREAYLHHRAATPWPDVRPKPGKVATRVRRSLLRSSR